MKPIPCISTKCGTKLTAWIDFVISTVAGFLSAGLIINYEQNQEFYMEEFIEKPNDSITFLREFVDFARLDALTIRIFLILNLTYWLQKIILGIILLRGIQKENLSLCRFWLISTVVVITQSVSCYLLLILLSVLTWKTIPLYSVCFLLREYIFWIVKTFVNDLNEIESKTCNNNFSQNFIAIGKYDYAVDMKLGPYDCHHSNKYRK